MCVGQLSPTSQSKHASPKQAKSVTYSFRSSPMLDFECYRKSWPELNFREAGQLQAHPFNDFVLSRIMSHKRETRRITG